MSLCHYVFVRRDLSVGKMAAMVVHAAGESAHLYEDENGRFRGATAVVLEAKGEAALHEVAEALRKEDIRCVEVYESAEPYANQIMAIGLVPLERDSVSKLLKKYQVLKTLNPPEEESDLWGV